MRTLITFLLIGSFLFCFAGATFASYYGLGTTPVGPSYDNSPSVRFGPSILGGGPGSGK